MNQRTKHFHAYNKATDRPYVPALVEVRNATGEGAAEILIYNDIGRNYWDDSGIVAEKVRAALKAIPAGKEIKVRINSGGGSVAEGLAIYNSIAERRENVTCYNDGYACSIASVILLAGKKAVCAVGSMTMIHEPWGMAAGDAEDMRRYADLLDKHKDTILDIYTSQTGLSREELSDYMKAETWWTGTEAVAVGFCDELGEEMEAAASANHDFSHFRRVPDSVKNRNQNKPAPKSGSGAKGQQMNRNKIIALLKAQGITVPDNATNEQVKLMLNACEYLVATERTEALNWLDTAEGKASEPKAQTPPAPAPAASAQPEAATAARIAALEAEAVQNKKAGIRAALMNLVNERRITADQVERYEARCMADPGLLGDLQTLPQNLPGHEPLNIVITGESGTDMVKALKQIGQVNDAFAKMRHSPDNRMREDMVKASKRFSEICQKNYSKLEAVLNANTVDSDLKLNVILSGQALIAFKRKLAALMNFSTNFGSVMLAGTDTIAVPYIPLHTTTSTSFNPANGYVYAEDVNTDARTVVIDKRKYQALTIASSFIARQPMAMIAEQVVQRVNQLAVDVWLDIHSIITNANYGAPAISAVTADDFDSSDVATLNGVANTADWPEDRRALVIGTSYHTNLLKEKLLVAVNESGTPDALRRGYIAMLHGFGITQSPRIPNNSENLVGYISYPSAVLVANSPIAPAPGVLAKLLSYQAFVDSDTGLTFEMRRDGDTQMDKDRYTIECNYGYGKGEEAALKRIVSPS